MIKSHDRLINFVILSAFDWWILKFFTWDRPVKFQIFFSRLIGKNHNFLPKQISENHNCFLSSSAKFQIISRERSAKFPPFSPPRRIGEFHTIFSIWLTKFTIVFLRSTEKFYNFSLQPNWQISLYFHATDRLILLHFPVADWRIWWFFFPARWILQYLPVIDRWILQFFFLRQITNFFWNRSMNFAILFYDWLAWKISSFFSATGWWMIFSWYFLATD